MKIAITTTGDDLSAPVDPRFGRARKFIVFDVDSGDYEVADNSQAANTSHGAGPQAAESISATGAEALVTGNIGPNAHGALDAAKIRVFIGAQGTVQDAIDAYRDGKLREAGGPNVAGHWG